MWRRYVLWGVVMFVAVFGTAEERCFSVEVSLRPESVVLGLPIRLQAEVRNVSGKPLRVAVPETGIIFPMVLETVHPDGQKGRVCGYCRARFAVTARELPADWQRRFDMSYQPAQVGTYSFRFVFLPEGYSQFLRGEDKGDIVWTTTSSDPFEVVVTEPRGVDAAAYGAFSGDPLGLEPEHFKTYKSGDLLRRFPESTYAAFVVWERWAKGVAPSWKDDDEREEFLRVLEKDPSHEYMTWKLPCREDGAPDADVITRFKMPAAARCRDAWLGVALKYHPDIWFADEIRLRLALDRYILGDKEGCEALLEQLAAKGRSDVVAKAGELVQAMRGKGMLPGGAASADVEASGGGRP